MVESLLPKLHERAKIIRSTFYQINAGANNTSGEGPVTRREKKGFTMILAMTKLDMWLNNGEESLRPTEYPVIINLKPGRIAALRDTTSYYIPINTVYFSYK